MISDNKSEMSLSSNPLTPEYSMNKRQIKNNVDLFNELLVDHNNSDHKNNLNTMSTELDFPSIEQNSNNNNNNSSQPQQQYNNKQYNFFQEDRSIFCIHKRKPSVDFDQQTVNFEDQPVNLFLTPHRHEQNNINNSNTISNNPQNPSNDKENMYAQQQQTPETQQDQAQLQLQNLNLNSNSGTKQNTNSIDCNYSMNSNQNNNNNNSNYNINLSEEKVSAFRIRKKSVKFLQKKAIKKASFQLNTSEIFQQSKRKYTENLHEPQPIDQQQPLPQPQTINPSPKRQQDQPPMQQQGCNCKKSKCLKQYCFCFSKQGYCGPHCNCLDCHNKKETEEIRQKALQEAMIRNPLAFLTGDGQTGGQGGQEQQEQKGCNCKKTKCLKKYCECYYNGVQCNQYCKCIDCHNCDNPPQNTISKLATGFIQTLQNNGQQFSGNFINQLKQSENQNQNQNQNQEEIQSQILDQMEQQSSNTNTNISTTVSQPTNIHNNNHNNSNNNINQKIAFDNFDENLAEDSLEDSDDSIQEQRKNRLTQMRKTSKSIRKLTRTSSIGIESTNVF